MTYPLPATAAYIWTEGETIWLGLPATTAERGHSVPVPATAEGLAQVLRILRAREKASRCAIATEAAPTRAQVEAALARREAFRAERQARAERAIPKEALADADAVLRELGMI